uniref:Uncharacterized protein n=1 Tax=Ditylenchus dipsaci TaxID=166011 RepID=A0A915E8I7_9BILA
MVSTHNPFFLQLALKIPYGRASDLLKSRGVLSNTAACRLFSQLEILSVKFGCYAASSIWTSCTISYLRLFHFYVVLAPAYSGAITSLAFGFCELTSALAPSMVAFFNKNGTTAEWSRIWYAVSLINLVGGLVFLFFGSADVQEWAMPNYSSNKSGITDKKDSHSPTKNNNISSDLV